MRYALLSIVAIVGAGYGIRALWRWEDPFLKNADRLINLHDEYAVGR